MASINLYSVKEGKIVSYDLEVDANGEIVATHGDSTLKFPAGLTKAKFSALVDKHNRANKGVVARSEEDIKAEEENRSKSEQLLKNL